MNAAAGLARNATAFATSSGVPMRPTQIKGVSPLLVKTTQVPNPVNNASRDKRSARLVSGPLNLKKIVRGRCSVSAVFRFFAEQFELGV